MISPRFVNLFSKVMLNRRATDRRKVINRFFFISKKENVALMRHCTIVQMISISDFELEVWVLNFCCKKRKQLVSPSLLGRDGIGCLNHFLTYNFGKVKKWYKGSQNTPNVLNINALHILKGSRKLHTIDHVSLITYWYTVYCTCCTVHTKGSHFLVNPCEPKPHQNTRVTGQWL